MHTIIRSGELTTAPNGTMKFEGEPYGSQISMFVMSTAPGEGPDLHVHPYSETWIVHAGSARFTADGESIEAGPGDILVAGPNTVHGFKNIGTERLDIICIHASPRVIQEWITE